MSEHYTDGRHWDDTVGGWALDADPYEDALLSREDLKARVRALEAHKVEADAYAQTAATELVRLLADRTERDRMLLEAWKLRGELSSFETFLDSLRARAEEGSENE